MNPLGSSLTPPAVLTPARVRVDGEAHAITDTVAAPSTGSGAPLMSLAALAPLMADSGTHLPAKADSITIFNPCGNGRFETTRKIPCDDFEKIVTVTDSSGDSRYFHTSGNGRFIHCTGADGETEMKIELPDHEAARRLLYWEKEKSLLVHTGMSLHRIDSEKGTITASFPFAGLGYNRAMCLKENGDLLLNSDSRLIELDSGLRETSSQQLNFGADCMETLPGGSTLLLHDSCPATIAIFSKEGKKVLDDRSGLLHSTIRGEDGQIYFMSGDIADRGKPIDLVRYDPATGDVLRVKSTRNANAVIPLKDGSMLVFDDRLADPRFISYDKEGAHKWNVTFEEKGYMRQFFLNEKESKAYFVMDKDSSQERCLYEVDLKEEPGMLGKIAGSLLSAGARRKPRLLYTEHSDHRGMTPVILEDGRMIMLSEKEIIVTDAGGNKQARYDTSADLLKDCAGARAVNRPFYIGVGSDFRDVDRNRDMLTGTINSMVSANPLIYSRMPVEKALGSSIYNENDNTLNWHDNKDEHSAFTAMNLSAEEYRTLIEGGLQNRDLTDLIMNNRVEIPFASGRVLLSKENITVEISGTRKMTETFRPEDKSHFITALPVTTGKHTWLFAGTDDGMVCWYDIDKSCMYHRFDTGEAVQGLMVHEKSVLAITTGGKILALEPLLQDGERLDASGGSPIMADPGSEQEPSVIQDDGMVEIDGIRLKKNQWNYAGGLRHK